MIENKAYLYCKKAVKENTIPKFVKLQMKDFMRICEGKNKKYKISEKKLKQLNGLLKLLNMPKGLKAGVPLAECTCGYQWLFYIAIFCVVYRNNEEKRRYETGLLEICRKNFKTYTVATIFILLLLTEPQFSKPSSSPQGLSGSPYSCSAKRESGGINCFLRDTIPGIRMEYPSTFSLSNLNCSFSGSLEKAICINSPE